MVEFFTPDSTAVAKLAFERPAGADRGKLYVQFKNHREAVYCYAETAAAIFETAKDESVSVGQLVTQYIRTREKAGLPGADVLHGFPNPNMLKAFAGAGRYA